jgi:integrase/recombinase XerD
MPIRLSTTVQKIFSLSNKANSLLLSEFYEYMKSNGVSESHQNNNLKVLIAFAKHLGPSNFLNTKLKSVEDDPDRKCLTTWNDYLGRLKCFFRWIYNCRKNSGNNDNKNLSTISQSEWETPIFVKIKEKKTKRLSPYSETELWEIICNL